MNEIHAFNSNEMALYFYLLRVNNLCSWKASFNHNNHKILATIGVSFNTFKIARNKLKQSGLIDFKTKNGSANAIYSILTSSKFDEVSTEVSDEVSTEVSDEVLSSKDKLKETSLNKPKKQVISVNERIKEFRSALAPFVETYDARILKSFYDYWTELNPSGKKMRFEMEKTWEMSKRLATWKRNDERYSKPIQKIKSFDDHQLSRAEKAELKRNQI
jgi:hypothetical protein